MHDNDLIVWVLTLTAFTVLSHYWLLIIALGMAFVFFVVPVGLCAWAFALAIRDRLRADAADEQPMGDATDTPRTLSNVRRVNFRREQS